MRFSFCTTCRDRLLDLSNTIQRNLALLQEREEIVVLDYGCPQHTLNWLTTNLMDPIAAGKLRVYRLDEAPRFRMSHAKNVAHLLGAGTVLVNLDADNYLDADYLTRLRAADWANGLAMLYPRKGSGGFKGRTATSREAFLAAGGYDEQFTKGYGHEEIDLYLRLKAAGQRTAHVVIDPAMAIPTPEALKNAAQASLEMPFSESTRLHRQQSEANIKARRLVANQGRRWGEAELLNHAGARIRVRAG